ncbi:hypothetical protein PFISCL1PPCAC_1306, partial [Pristionchus fissidentatus]
MNCLLLMPLLVVTVNSRSLEWCEYWTLREQKDSRPECAMFFSSKETILSRLYPAENPTVDASPIAPFEAEPATEPAAAPPKCESEREI